MAFWYCTRFSDVIAQRIVERARAGVRDRKALCKIAVKDLMVP
jgi:hypothetical protein